VLGADPRDRLDKSTALTRSLSDITGWLGSFPAILLAAAVIACWVAGGFFVSGHFGNNTYQLLINTGTTIITFLMVFIIQNTQNRDGRAMQAKLDAQAEALVAIMSHLGCQSDVELTRLIGVEDAPDRVIKQEQDQVRGNSVRHH